MSAMLKEVYDAFISIGVAESKAAVAAEAINRHYVDNTSTNLATKTDISKLRSELKDDISKLRSELKDDISKLRSELKDDISKLRSELKDDISELKDAVVLLDKRLAVLEVRQQNSDRLLWIIIAGTLALLLKEFIPVLLS